MLSYIPITTVEKFEGRKNLSFERQSIRLKNTKKKAIISHPIEYKNCGNTYHCFLFQPSTLDT